MSAARAVRNERTGAVLARAVLRATNPWTRGVGLLPRAAVSADEGLWIDGCAAVHTIGMRATIDLYFLDRAGCVVRVARHVRPGRLSVSARGARTVVELGEAEGAGRDVRVGDRLALE